MVNYSEVGQATDKNTAYAYCVLDTSGYKHTLRICSNYCFITTTMVARTRLSVTLYVHCLSCFIVCCASRTDKVAYLETINVWLKIMMIY